jgi:hypothetical protein
MEDEETQRRGVVSVVDSVGPMVGEFNTEVSDIRVVSNARHEYSHLLSCTSVTPLAKLGNIVHGARAPSKTKGP